MERRGKTKVSSSNTGLHLFQHQQEEYLYRQKAEANNENCPFFSSRHVMHPVWMRQKNWLVFLASVCRRRFRSDRTVDLIVSPAGLC